MKTFKVSVDNVIQSSCHPAPEIEDDLLVDTGAMAHILNNSKCFSNFDHDFDPASQFPELADGRRVNNMAKCRGCAHIKLMDSQGNPRDVELGRCTICAVI